ncbi:MAG: ORF6N domain-containing protein [Campylobacterota bacterium]|nr:ORF6N domain-containing protein [Campylobacterota bacterium]
MLFSTIRSRKWRTNPDYRSGAWYQISNYITVKRNIKRFPSDFMFQLSEDEFKNSGQFVISTFRTW